MSDVTEQFEQALNDRFEAKCGPLDDVIRQSHHETARLAHSVYGPALEQLRDERDAIAGAARSALAVYSAHVRTAHPGRLTDPGCDVCRMGVTLSRYLPARPDSREEIERRLAALNASQAAGGGS